MKYCAACRIFIAHIVCIVADMVIFTAGEQELGLWLVGLKRDHVAAMLRISTATIEEVDTVADTDAEVHQTQLPRRCNLTIFLSGLVGFCSCLTGVLVWTMLQPHLLLLCLVAWGCRPLFLCMGTLSDYALLTAAAYAASVLFVWCVPAAMLFLCGTVVHLEHLLVTEAARLGACSSVLLGKCWLSRGIGLVSGTITGLMFDMRSMFVVCAAVWLCAVFFMPCRKHALRLQWSWRINEWICHDHTQQSMLALVMWTALPNSDWNMIRLLSPLWKWVFLCSSAAVWFVGSRCTCLSVRCAIILHALLSMAPKLLLVSVPYAQAAVVTMGVLKTGTWCAAVRAMVAACMQYAPIGVECQCIALIGAMLSFSALVSALTGAYVWHHDTPLLGIMCGIVQFITMPLVLKAYSSTTDDSDSQATDESDMTVSQ